MTLVRGRLYAGNYQDSCRNLLMGFCSQGERLGSTLNTTRKKWEFIAKELAVVLGCAVDRKLIKMKHWGQGEESSKRDFKGYLLKAGYGDQLSSRGWWRMRNLPRYQGREDIQCRVFWLNWHHKISVKIGQ